MVFTKRGFFYSIKGSKGRLAQLVRAPRLHRGGHMFESCSVQLSRIQMAHDLMLTITIIIGLLLLADVHALRASWGKFAALW